ncbi:hypothetical protein [Enorma burkinafasonensis]|uniref:hypothetical protein n=1 Tax=Enorma burkinafasonensis TaxID=2590867 RepID=UPI00119F1777|nr:hypothetical protein [Enorma burkinafasonensis]
MNDFLSGVAGRPLLQASESWAFAAHVRASAFQIARCAAIRALAGPRNRAYLNCAAKIPHLRSKTPPGRTGKAGDGTERIAAPTAFPYDDPMKFYFLYF